VKSAHCITKNIINTSLKAAIIRHKNLTLPPTLLRTDFNARYQALFTVYNQLVTTLQKKLAQQML